MDQLFVNARLRVRPDGVVHVRRELPSGNTKVNIAVGQEVSPGDVLGEGHTVAGFRTINLAHDLNVKPPEVLSYLACGIGKTIFEGELLAVKKEFYGFKKRIITSPVDGVIDYFDSQKGDLRIRLIPKSVKTVSGVYGIVDFIDEANGTVFVRTAATLVYGVLSSGKQREGFLRVLGSSETLVSSPQIIENMSGQIIVGGSIVFKEALEKAVGLGVAGIITGGINARDYKGIAGGSWNFKEKSFSDVGITVFATEGFGAAPIGEDIFPFLKNYDGKFVILDGRNAVLILPSQNQNSMIYIRKTVLPVKSEPASRFEIELEQLKVGSRVRIVSGLRLGQQGKVVAIDRSLSRLISGIMTYMIMVETSREKIKMPYTNVEIIG